jgi:hypothetical protein
VKAFYIDQISKSILNYNVFFSNKKYIELANLRYIHIFSYFQYFSCRKLT